MPLERRRRRPRRPSRPPHQCVGLGERRAARLRVHLLGSDVRADPKADRRQRGPGDVDADGTPDVIAGSFGSSDGADQAGKAQIFSGADGSVLRTITSTTPLETFGFDAVGLGDTNGDGIPDALVSAATGDHVYVIAGNRIP